MSDIDDAIVFDDAWFDIEPDDMNSDHMNRCIDCDSTQHRACKTGAAA